MIKLINICKTFNKNIKPFLLFENLNLNICKSKLTCIIGRSGCGKTTLLNIIGSLDSPDSGEVYINNINITNYNEDELARYRNEKIGYIFQDFILEKSMTVIENVCLPLVIKGVKKTERNKSALAILEKLDLLDKKDEIVLNLSGGEAQRVCIARALISNPDIILADEPTGQLDYENGQLILTILKDLTIEGKTVVLVTHNLEDAKKYADEIITMNNGKIIETCSYEN